MELFFHSELINGIIELDDTETRHVRVLRKKMGDSLLLTDGMGHRADGKIIEASPKKCLLQVNDIQHVERPKPQLILGVSPLKNPDRFEWLVEKCTESGVETIVPIICDRTEVPLKKTDRLQRIIQAATIQSLQYYMPELTQPCRYADFFSRYNAPVKLIAWCNDAPKMALINALPERKDAIILIGPEGDFTAEEYGIASRSGFQAISLGQNRLRTETAAVFAAQAFYLINSK